MNQKLTIVFEQIKNENRYSLVLPMGAPLGEAYDFVYDCLKQIMVQANQAAEKAEEARQSQATQEVEV